jgi:guanylate kinase
MESSKILFVISSPSGGGKTTLTRKLVERLSGIKHSISFTTRKPHQNEKDGLDYHFINAQRFEDMVNRGEMLEWVEIYGHRYGTCKHAVQQLHDLGNDVILTIDTQGAAQLRAGGVEVVCIFLMPPSANILAERLHKRNRDTKEMINFRLAFAQHEFRQIYHYDYIVINDSFEKALEEIAAIIVAERCRKDRILPCIKKQWREMIEGDPTICNQS